MKNIWKVLSLPETMLGDFLFKPGCIIFLVDDGRRWVTGDFLQLRAFRNLYLFLETPSLINMYTYLFIFFYFILFLIFT